MGDYWEDKFSGWAQPPGPTEQQKCDNAISVIRKAIENSTALKNRHITIFAQGSYRNRTNVRADSDVDICVLCHETMFYDIPQGMTATDFGFEIPPEYNYTEYKNDVENALVNYFGRSSVHRGNKAFDIHENTYRVAADVVACFDYKWYTDRQNYLLGTAFLTDNTQRIVNWPQQNYDNGVKKNDETNRGFKAIVRILKYLRNEMAEDVNYQSKIIPSFLIECLAWNAKNQDFGNITYKEDLRQIIIDVYKGTNSQDTCNEWGEINELKYLFRASQPWTREQANNFLSATWNYVGYQ